MMIVKILSTSIIILLIAYLIITILAKANIISDEMEKLTGRLGSLINKGLRRGNNTEIYEHSSKDHGTAIIPDWSVEIGDINGNTSQTIYVFQLSSHRNSKITIGTGNCDIKIDCQGSLYVGRNHASLVFKNDIIYLIDNDSTNKTFNQKHEAITETVINAGDVVYLSDLIALHFNAITAREYYEMLKSDRKVKHV